MKILARVIVAVLLTGILSAAQALSLDDLQPEAPSCKMPDAARPKLPPKLPADDPSWDTNMEIIADFNGDGWCDYALGVPFPFNSYMNSFYLSEELLLGGHNQWRSPFHGKEPWKLPIEISGSEGVSLWPTFQVDLTEMAALYPKTGGSPFVLGLKDGYNLGKTLISPGCHEYANVHRWDDEVDAFRKVDEATQRVVLDYYYSKVEKPCKERPKVEIYFGTPYEKLLHRSPELKTQDTYLNQAYRYLTTGQTILQEVPPRSKPGLYYCGLPREEIKALKTEQRAWIKARDKQALEAGAFGTDAYIAALLEITKKRNAELKALIEKHPPKDDACRQLLPKE